jgi:hypothetical protein
MSKIEFQDWMKGGILGVIVFFSALLVGDLLGYEQKNLVSVQIDCLGTVLGTSSSGGTLSYYCATSAFDLVMGIGFTLPIYVLIAFGIGALFGKVLIKE